MADDQRLRILLVDNDEDLLELLKYNFRKEGFRVKTVSSVEKAMRAVKKFQPALIVLDVIMPDGNGIDLCKRIRQLSDFKNTFIFFLSARSENICRQQAFDTGADDFIEKLSGLRALTNKVNAVLKKKYVIKKRISELASEELVVDKKAEAVYLKGKEMSLSAPEFEILFFLMQNPNTVIPRKDLIKIIWGSELFVLDSSVETYLHSLQRKLGPKFIETVHHGHYRFIRRSY